MQNNQSNVPVVRLYEAELHTLGVPYLLIDRSGPQCGAGAIVVVEIQPEEQIHAEWLLEAAEA